MRMLPFFFRWGRRKGVIRYHFRMKHLEERIQQGVVGILPAVDDVKEMEEIRDFLINDLAKR